MKLRSRIVLFTLAILVPSMMTGAWLLYSGLEREREASKMRVRETTRALSLAVDREIERRAAIVEVLAASPALQSWDLPAFCGLAKAALLGSVGPVAVRDNERQYMNTGTATCAVPPLDTVPNAVSFSMQSVVLSELFVGSVSHQYLLIVSAPAVVAGRDFNVGLGIRPAELQRVLVAQRLPEDWSAAVLDKRGVVVARMPDPQLWVGKPGLAFAANATQPKQDLPLGQRFAEGERSGRDRQGSAVTVFYSSSGSYGLTFFVAVPTRLVSGVDLETQRDLWLGAVALTVAGLLFALWVSGRAVEPVEALQQAARNLQHGKPVALPTIGVVELAAIGAALHVASGKIAAANVAMEQKVAEAVATTETTQRQLLASQKLEAVGRVAGGLAHDFNNLLQTLSTGLHVLQALPQEERARPVLDAGLRAVHRAASLVQQMLYFARPPTFERQTVDLRDQLLALQELLGGGLPANLQLQIKMAPDLWHINTDPGQLSSALLNLLFNARDAMSAGGVIQLRAVNSTDSAGEWVLIEIEDHGAGIAAEDSPHIFEAFYTTKPVGRGTGLGLAQVLRFAESSGGSVSASSRPGEGTVLRLRLPRDLRSPASNEQRITEPQSLPRPCRLLFVDDDLLAAQVVVPALQLAGFMVTASRTADEALVLLNGGLGVDVVFSDIVMPGLVDGFELAKRIAARWPQLPVVLATGYARVTPDAGAVRVLSKPFSIQDLIRTLVQLMPADDRA
jgi:signal transduction histidine kinase